MSPTDNRLSIIKKAGQICGGCGKSLALGAVVTWVPGDRGQFSSSWRCVEGESACCPRDPEVIAAKKAGKMAVQQVEPATSERLDVDASLISDMVYPSTPEQATPTATTTAQASGSQVDAFGVLASALLPHIESRLAGKTDAAQVLRIVDDRVLDLIETAVHDLERKLNPVVRIEVKRPDGQVGQIDGAHPAAEEVIALLSIGQAVYMYGPAGAGKTYGAHQIADALGCRVVEFQAGKLSTESLLRGFIGAHGERCDSLFPDAYGSDDVLIFLDEFDRWPTHLQVLLNSALANGYLQSRFGSIRRGRNHILAAGNTNMRGRNEYFTEAVPSEFSTIDRFAFVSWDYDTAHEDRIVDAINPHARPWVQWIRRIQPEALSGRRGKILATPRAMYDGARLLRYTRLPIEKIADSLVFKGLDSATRDYFVSTFPLPVIPQSQREAFHQGVAA